MSDDEIMSYLKKMELFKESKRYNLDEIIDNKSLSSGQMQKVSFIRALVGNVDIMLLDESTANLDEKSRKLIFDILRNQEISIINSTHDIDSFKNYTHHFKIELSKGKRLLKKVV